MVSDRIKEGEKHGKQMQAFFSWEEKNGDHFQGYCAQENFYFLVFILK